MAIGQEMLQLSEFLAKWYGGGLQLHKRCGVSSL